MTLEKIKEMNIPVGAPIEVTLNSEISMGLVKGPNNKLYRELGYYRNATEIIDDDNFLVPILKYDRATGSRRNPEEPMKRAIEISSVEEIKILKYEEGEK